MKTNKAKYCIKTNSDTKLSFVELYMNNPLITVPSTGGEPVATIFGIPFDSTHSYKPGCRFGPDAIRDAFNNIEIFHPDMQVDLESVNIEDLGNMTHTVVVSEMIDMTKKITTELLNKNRLLLILGGEHSITHGTYTSFPKDTCLVIFDAHYDLRNQYAGTMFSHASFLRRIIEQRGADNIIHVGARAFVREELAFLTEHKIKTISDKDIRNGSAPQLVSDAVSIFDRTYASFDLDVLDPAFAPGVGNPEAEGITSRELFCMIRAMGETRLVGADIVELNPTHDTGITASLAAKIVSTILAMNISKS